MTPEVAVVMPMAGRGSRFATGGEPRPKPLIELHGRPFFWWAIESVRRAVHVRELVCVVLEEHCRHHALDAAILRAYPDARVVRLPEPTVGAAATAAAGVMELTAALPLVVNDCDHAFVSPQLQDVATSLRDGETDAPQAALCCFRSSDPAYSYVRFGPTGVVLGTVEKQVVSEHAIAGCYLFASPRRFQDAYERYRWECPYPEQFVSGLYNIIVREGGAIACIDLEAHASFGTPEEHTRLANGDFTAFSRW